MEETGGSNSAFNRMHNVRKMQFESLHLALPYQSKVRQSCKTCLTIFHVPQDYHVLLALRDIYGHADIDIYGYRTICILSLSLPHLKSVSINSLIFTWALPHSIDKLFMQYRLKCRNIQKPDINMHVSLSLQFTKQLVI